MGAFLDLTLSNPLTYGSSSSLPARPSKKWVYLLRKFGTTQTKSISLLFDFKSRT